MMVSVTIEKGGTTTTTVPFPLVPARPCSVSGRAKHMLMIRPFTVFCKLNKIHLSDRQWFAVEASSLTPCGLECPSCGAKGCMKPFACYGRYLVGMGEGKEEEGEGGEEGKKGEEGEGASVHRVRVQRLRCSSCGHTHAFHPSCLVPYRSHSLRFILRVLQCYFLHLKTVARLCDAAGISVSTLYRWVALFLAQKRLWLGVLGDMEKAQGSFLEGLSGQGLLGFLAAMRFSFLEHMPGRVVELPFVADASGGGPT